MQIDFKDNTVKNFICVSSGVEPKEMQERLDKEIIEHWFDAK